MAAAGEVPSAAGPVLAAVARDLRRQLADTGCRHTCGTPPRRRPQTDACGAEQAAGGGATVAESHQGRLTAVTAAADGAGTEPAGAVRPARTGARGDGGGGLTNVKCGRRGRQGQVMLSQPSPEPAAPHRTERGRPTGEQRRRSGETAAVRAAKCGKHSP